MAISPLVPDIAPLLQSLQQFTPQARQNRQFQLAGLEQQQALGAENLQQAQTETKRAQIISLAEQSRADLLGDKSDLTFVMKNGAKGLRNRLALLAKDKDPGSADFNDIVKITNIVATDPERGLNILNLELEKTQSGLDRVNQILNRTRGAATAGQREFASLTKGFSPEDELLARRVSVGLEARAGTVTGQERIATTPDLTEAVSFSQEQISKGKETGKLKAQAELLPDIRKKIKLAEKEAAARGETITDLNRAKAALPGLKEVSEKLKILADIATVTFSKQGLDILVKELGFGATKGATARTTMRAIVDNQVLPLLRETFGAAFTKEEGDSLRATLLDQNTAPEQMKATLDAFIEQKVRNIETKEAELPTGETFTSSSGITFTVQ